MFSLFGMITQNPTSANIACKSTRVQSEPRANPCRSLIGRDNHTRLVASMQNATGSRQTTSNYQSLILWVIISRIVHIIPRIYCWLITSDCSCFLDIWLLCLLLLVTTCSKAQETMADSTATAISRSSSSSDEAEAVPSAANSGASLGWPWDLALGTGGQLWVSQLVTWWHGMTWPYKV